MPDVRPVSAVSAELDLHELLAFPIAKYDDQVDSTSQALKWISDKSQEPSYLVIMRRLLAEEAGITEEEAVHRMKHGIAVEGYEG